MRAIPIISIMIIGVMALYKFRYKVLNVLFAIKGIRKLAVSTMMKVPNIDYASTAQTDK